MIHPDAEDFFDTGLAFFPHDAALKEWIAAVHESAYSVIQDPANSHWWRHGGTWFVGVHALPNDDRGAVQGGPPLSGTAINFVRENLEFHDFAWDRAQLSVCRPGYPQPSVDETAASLRYRIERDAAHVDGLLAEGSAKRRFVREHHAFIMGIPLTEVTAETSPFVIWEGSHHIMRRAFAAAFADMPPELWHTLDITDAYHAARKEVFATCRRIEVTANPGECYLAHRLSLHGVAPWRGADPDQAPRAVAYFRPTLLDAKAWLEAR